MRRTALRRRSKSPRAKIIKEMDRLWREVVFATYGTVCKAEGQGGMRCGGGLQAHHIYGKGAYPRMRYTIPNGIPVCGGHHQFWVHGSSASPNRAADVQAWYFATCGAKRMASLDLQSSLKDKTKMDLKAIKIWLEQELSRVA